MNPNWNAVLDIALGVGFGMTLHSVILYLWGAVRRLKR